MVTQNAAKGRWMPDVNRLIALYNAGRLTDVVALGEKMIRQEGPTPAVYNVLGAAYAQLRRPDKAAEFYGAGARLDPGNADAHNNEGIALVELGRLAQAAESFRRATEAGPKLAEAFNNLGFTLSALQRYEEAAQALEHAVALKPKYAEAHNNLGIALGRIGRHDDAVKSYQRALRHKPDHAQAHSNLGNALWRLGRREEAAASFQRALRADPNLADAHNGIGAALAATGKLEEAIGHYRRALANNPNSVDVLNNLGVALREKRANEEALAQLAKAIKLRPDFVDAWNNLGVTLEQMGEHEKAADVYMRALHINPASADTHFNLGNALSAMGRTDEATASYNHALTLAPGHAGACNNLGLALLKLGKAEEAAAALMRAIELKPDFADAHLSLGVALADLRRHADAIESFTRALSLQPDNALARAQRLHQQALICDWAGVAADAALIPALGVSVGVVPPFSMLALEDHPARHRVRAERFVAERHVAKPSPRAAPPATRPEQLRIGYFSGDVRDHAVMFLVAKVFELHDRGRFGVNMYSYGPDRGGAMRARVSRAMDAFHDVRAMPDADVVALARRDGIDIAVDLSGHTQRSRSALFAHRLAPVQINFLGYPGTIGARTIDYIIADRIVIPESARAHYTENPIYLPHTYQPNDDTRPIADLAMTRAAAGLPDDAFVFCSFNNSYKITAAEFDVWMRLLAAVERSVLWLLQPNDVASENLRRAAAARGVDPDRIVYASPLPLHEHLARHRLADLFLDTFTYNAHTTASDALWAGLPLVTKIGQGFAARVAASLLNAIGLTELITETEQAYFELALDLAQNPNRLAGLKQRLDANRSRKPLFDSELFTRHLEKAYDAAYQRYLDRLEPDAIIIGS